MKAAFKKSVILFLSLCIAIESIACGGGGYYMDYDMLFDRNILFDNGKKTTTYNAWVYNSEFYAEDSPRIQNTESWATYLENVYRKEDLERFIYRSSGVKFDKTKEQKRLRSKRMSDTDISKKETLFLDFIAYALKVEKVISDNTPDPWAEEVKEINLTDFNDRITEGKALIKAVKDDFMKERYAFQLIKLYRYSNQFEDAEKTYKTYFSNSTSLIGYWAMEHYAGILMKQNKPFEANYYFIKVYTNCPSKRESSYLSMQLDSEEDFKKTLALFTETEEKMALHYVRSMQTKALGLEDMQIISKTLGNHEYARIIMTHEINKLEKGLLTEDESDDKQDEKLLAEQLGNYTKDLIAFNEEMLAKDGEDQFWHLSLAYLYYLNGQHAKCSALLEKIHPKTPDFQKQHTIIYIVNYLGTRQTLTEIDENIIGEKLFALNGNSVSYPFLHDEREENYYETDEYNTVNQFIFRQIYKRSQTKNAFLELIFSGQTISDLQSEYLYDNDEKSEKPSELAHIDQVLNDLAKTPETTLSIYAANYFFYNYDYSRNSNLDFEQCEQQLKEFKATLLMRDPDRLQEAVAIFRELPKNMQGESIYGDPFKFDLKNPGFDRFDENRYSQPSMTKYELAKTLNELNKKKSTAKDYYNLGLAYYNTSYYGLQWKAMAYYRSSYAPNGFYSMKTAQVFFKKALAFGKLTDEQEAQIYFMLARCEQHEYTQKNGEITAYFDSNNRFSFDTYMGNMRSDGAFSNFEILDRNYRNTAFYDELINECYYFNYYIN
ncbi:MAG: hypothetical protein A3D31_06585 [Candidatus Fluviicola riflensis]|nr:MAG: hypothetical protein CHH17_08425 [Candidatus Fluviicola riflensis]OGS79626.1 MAG: hypothetical protein A3D31_06585 [Candidatus Fluviicola riflensis]OGS87057.1 MAG: hypothetical protein A2724_06045 [Fluviicola sp. RIFCSPHIGHO2_01_FULL_43_53]OGS89849.1 MAG: hypothetical protein A3E30_02795 [Fluviicola sp. RIFCSPHIGHO2_12_FULL_43_24]